MVNTVAWEAWAPAKINLYLEVLGRRSDGYHELETVMTALRWFDTIRFIRHHSPDIEVHTTWTSGMTARYGTGDAALGDLPEHRINIVTKALTLFKQRAEVGYGATVWLRKRIPSAAGLGGASSDAAAALVVANQAWQVGWSRGQLATLAAELGSDVPFFLSGQKWAACRGRGELIQGIDSNCQVPVVVVRPPVGLATSEVFGRVVLNEVMRPLNTNDLIQVAGGAIPGKRRLLLNRLQSAAAQLTPWIQRLQEEFTQLPVVAHQMSGSGSSYFGICRHRRVAEFVANRLRARHVGHVVATTTTTAYPIIHQRMVNQ